MNGWGEVGGDGVSVGLYRTLIVNTDNRGYLAVNRKNRLTQNIVFRKVNYYRLFPKDSCGGRG